MTMPSYWKHCLVEEKEPEPIMTKQEYADFKQVVAEFFEREGIENLTSGNIWCPACGVDFDDSGKCPECHESKDTMDRPYFSKWPCECCRSTLHGDRIDCVGYNPRLDRILEYAICTDCVNYILHGHLERFE